jgi:hypothetical protein
MLSVMERVAPVEAGIVGGEIDARV